MLKKEINNIELSIENPYEIQLVNIPAGIYRLRIIHQSRAVFDRPRSLFFTFDIPGLTPQEIRDLLGLKDISAQNGVFAYAGGGEEKAGFYVQEVELNVTQELSLLILGIKTFLQHIDISIDILQLSLLSSFNNDYVEVLSNDKSDSIEDEDAQKEDQEDLTFIDFSEINSISFAPFSLTRQSPKKIYLKNIKKGSYTFEVEHQNKELFNNYKNLFFTFEIPGIESLEQIKDLLGLKSISPVNGVFAYAVVKDSIEGKYNHKIEINISSNISNLYVNINTFLDSEIDISKLNLLRKVLDSGAITKKGNTQVISDMVENSIRNSNSSDRETYTGIVKELNNITWIQDNLIRADKNNKALKVACILDDFTYNSYKYECDLHQLSRDNWFKDLENIQPDLLFVESAWRGKNDQWYNLINKNTKELQEIVKWCNRNKIPTVFWNKEDPIHFQTFINTAQQFDYVFTTDIDCVVRYKEVLGHDNVSFLPFACQPAINNPIELYERNDRFCFAGAYYVKYPERTKDLDNIVEFLGNYKGVDIYDRNFYNDDPNYQFPAKYDQYIVGTLPFEEIDKAYKGYKYSINLNSIKQSQSMFARRVYELLGSNTLTVSNFSRGIRFLFGDLVFSSDSGKELVRRLEAIISDDFIYHKFRLLGLRKVMLEHTYEYRINTILERVLPEYSLSSYLPKVSILAMVDSQDALSHILSTVKSFKYPNVSIIIVDKTSGLNLPQNRNYSVYRLNELENISLNYIVEDSYLALLDCQDYYAPNYLLDLVLATKYSQANIIGKKYYFVKNSEGIQKPLLDTYIPVDKLLPSNSLVCKSVFSTIEVAKYLNNDPLQHGAMLSIDPFNYCKAGYNLTEAEIKEITDLEVNEGLSLTSLVAISDKSIDKVIKKTNKELKKLLKRKDNSKSLSPQNIFEVFNSQGKALISLEHSDNRYFVDSNLDRDKHDYVYSNNYLSIKELSQNSILSYCFIDGDLSLDIQLTLRFLDNDKKVLGSQILAFNKTQKLEPILLEADYIQLGWRVKGSGSAIIKELQFFSEEDLAEPKYILHENLLLEPNDIKDIFASSGTKSVELQFSDGDYIVHSGLEDSKHEYIYAKNYMKLGSDLSKTKIPLYFEATPGLDIQLVILFMNREMQRIGHQIEFPRINKNIEPIEGTEYLQLGWRVRGSGAATIKNIYFQHQNFDPSVIYSNADVLVLTNNYPSYTDLYKNAFVHSRVKAYKQAGIDVDVFKFNPKGITLTYDEFEDVDVIQGSASLLDTMLSSGNYKKILVHFLDEDMWAVLSKYLDKVKVIVWIHGADIQPWWRRKFNYEDYTDHQLEEVKLRSAKRESFWKEVLSIRSSSLHFIFVSQQFANEVMADYDIRLPENQYSIIHNFIDTDVFQYQEKDPEMRKKILSIRPFASKTYANDLTVKAILELSKEPFFNELSFSIIGDGPLFDEVTEPLKKFDNVRLEKKFLNQQEIVEEHKKHGVFLVPTRMDTQGVSRGEAMASGLVAITNRVAAIPEFCSEKDTLIAEAEDYLGLVKCIKSSYFNVEDFKKYSKNAFCRVNNQCGYKQTILEEINLVYSHE